MFYGKRVIAFVLSYKAVSLSSSAESLINVLLETVLYESHVDSSSEGSHFEEGEWV